jgi:hypothetical protein
VHAGPTGEALLYEPIFQQRYDTKDEEGNTMRKLSVYLMVVLLGIMLLPALSMAQGATDAAEDEAADIEMLTPDNDEADLGEALDALAAPVVKSCNFGASGDGCVFDVPATGGGTLEVDTRAVSKRNRWRATIVELGQRPAASNIGTGSTTAFTGLVTQAVVSRRTYEVVVIHERLAAGLFPAGVEVRFNGPVTVSGPRARSGGGGGGMEEPQTCRQITGSAVADVETIGCGALIVCSINPVGDTDAFTFSAPARGAVSITTAKRSGPGSPYQELFDPDGSRVFGSRLPKTGKYTIIVSEFVNNDTVDYTLSLHRVGGS